VLTDRGMQVVIALYLALAIGLIYFNVRLHLA
jgi:hypothetical protein